MRDLQPGEVLEVRTDDPAARVGVPAWCRLTGNRLVHTSDRPRPHRPTHHPDHLPHRQERELNMSTNDTTTPPAILIQGTHGADNAEKATLPFIVGNVSATADQDTVVFLTSDAVWLATRGYADDITFAEPPAGRQDPRRLRRQRRPRLGLRCLHRPPRHYRRRPRRRRRHRDGRQPRRSPRRGPAPWRSDGAPGDRGHGADGERPQRRVGSTIRGQGPPRVRPVLARGRPPARPATPDLRRPLPVLPGGRQARREGRSRRAPRAAELGRRCGRALCRADPGHEFWASWQLIEPTGLRMMHGTAAIRLIEHMPATRWLGWTLRTLRLTPLVTAVNRLLGRIRRPLSRFFPNPRVPRRWP